MCGRFHLARPEALDPRAFGVAALPEFLPRYNIAPTQPVVAVIADGDEGRRAGLLRWGLVPAWAKDPAIGNKLANARAETVAEKPSFRTAFRRRRCLVLADGLYEWQARAGRGPKQPYDIGLADGAPFAFAGLWEQWRDPSDPEAAPLATCTLLTTTPNALMAPIHDRMPVILPREQYATWLAADADAEALRALLVPYPAEAMRAVPVSTWVNVPAHDTPQCLAPIPPS